MTNQENNIAQLTSDDVATVSGGTGSLYPLPEPIIIDPIEPIIIPGPIIGPVYK
jgi:hypothetical protein